MVDKKEEKRAEKRKFGESLGISGFTLGVVSIILVLFIPMLGILSALIGLTFCVIQQKKNPTKKGKSGIILNIIGFVVNTAWWIILIKYIVPLLQQNFPA